MWVTILSLVLGAVPAIVGQIAKAKVDAQNAKTEQERIAANERIKALEAQKDVLIAESTTPWNTIGRIFLMLPFGLLAWKLVVYDWMLGWGSTPKLSDMIIALMFTVYGFYFVTDITRILKR